MSYISMGVDQSTSATGIVVLAMGTMPKPVPKLITSICPSPDWSPFQKQKFILMKLLGYIDKFAPDIVVPEGYGLNMRRPSSVIPLVELGGVIKYHLQMRKQLHMTPKPGTVKSFATGNGSAKKPQMATALIEQYHREKISEDEVDAYWLALFGLAFQNKLGLLTPQQRHAIGLAERPE